MKKLENKVALITGGARGMGANHVKRFINEGAKVYFTDVLEKEGLQLAEELGSEAVFLKHDVTSEEDWKMVLETIGKQEGRLDILVNNAGIARIAPLVETTLEDFMFTVKVNQVSVFLGLKHALSLLKQSKDGAVVNISSMAGINGYLNGGAYSSSKFGVRGLTQVAAKEFAPFNIRVNSVHPGIIATPMIIQDDTKNQIEEMRKIIPLNKIGTSDDITNMVLFLACEDSSFCTAGEFVVDGGHTRT